MIIKYSRRFIKKLQRCDIKIQKTFREKLSLFIDNKFHPQLNNHALKGEFHKYRSININSNWRAIFIELDNGEIIFFEAIGTHSELYG